MRSRAGSGFFGDWTGDVARRACGVGVGAGDSGYLCAEFRTDRHLCLRNARTCQGAWAVRCHDTWNGKIRTV